MKENDTDLKGRNHQMPHITCTFAGRMKHPSQFLDAADITLIRSYAGEAERTGRLTPQQLSLAFSRGWFRALVPVSAGGSEYSLPHMMQLLEAAAWADGSFGWTLNLGAGANMFAGFLEADTATRIFADRFIVIAGSGTLSGIAEKRDDGYIVNGNWRYATGSSHAKFFSLTSVLSENGETLTRPDGTLKTRSFLIPREQVSITGSWNGHGMKATATRDYSVDQVWIPEELSFDLEEPVATGILYRFPFIQLAEALLSIALIGICLHFTEELETIVVAKQHDTNEIVIATGRMMECRAQLYASVASAWEILESDRTLSSDQLSAISIQARNSVQCCRMEASRIYPLGGMNVINPESAINRAWRDMHTASQHVLLSPFN